MQRIKVAIVTQFPADPGAPHGGVEAVSLNLVQALTAFSDLEIHVLTLDPSTYAVVRSAYAGATIHRLPRRRGSMLLNAIGAGRRQICRYLRELGPDIVHAHDTYGLMVKGLLIPRVFTIHGFIYGDTLVSGGRFAWLRSLIWHRVERAGWADQPHIVSISPYVRERLTGIATGMIHDIDNPLAESVFGIERDEDRRRILSAAVISPRKNTLALLEAFSRLVTKGVDAELRLAGAVIDTTYGRRVEDYIKANGLGGKVIRLGRIDTAQMEGELARAAVFALVSLEENSPMVIEEAMAAGVPVVTSNRCGMPYMVRHGESGYLVDPLDPDDISRRLKQLVLDEGLRQAMAIKSRDIALDRFHPGPVARRTREVYFEALRVHMSGQIN